MAEPVWVANNVVLEIHAIQLQIHGGMAGLRDEGLLSSALNRPRNLWAYSPDQADLPALATAYAHGIARNHPFLDGNKRTSAVVCETFLELNGMRLTASNSEWYDAMIRLAAGKLCEEDFASWLRERLISA